METSGLDPEITICKIAVLPVKLCPLLLTRIKISIYRYFFLRYVSICIYSYFFLVLYKLEYNLKMYPRKDLNLHDTSQRSLSSSCLPISALGY